LGFIFIFSNQIIVFYKLDVEISFIIVFVKKSIKLLDMDIEPLPKVTFLPAQLTELVIKNWTGDIIDYEKNG
jgi:hypothetical protein